MEPSREQGQPTATPTQAESTAVDLIKDLTPDGVPTWAAQIVLAVVVVIVAYYLSRVLKRLLSRRVAKRFARPSISRMVLRSIQGGVVALGVFAAVNILGLRFGDLALSLSVFSAVLGFVLAPVIGSVIQGVFVLTERAFEIGDMVEFTDTGTTGFVEDITLRYTKIFTMDNTFLVIPNGTMRERDVVNYSAEDPRTRQSLQLLVTYESDIGAARRIMEDSASALDNVIEGGPDIRIGSARYPAAPTCYIDEYADHGVLLTLRYWLKEPYKLLTMRSRVQENVWAELADADVEIAYPHRHLVFDDTSGEMQLAMREAGSEPGQATDGPAGSGSPPGSDADAGDRP